ncbi:MAG: hypothetical protein ACK47E_18090 [Cyclobacteriaceae bacterium]
MRKIYLIGLLILVGCGSQQKLALKVNTKIDVLGIDLQINPAINQVIHSELNKQLDDFIILYNSENHPFKIARSVDSKISSLQIRVQAVELVSPQKQATGVIVSLLGLSLPFVMAASKSQFVNFFYYFPKTASLSELSLTDDIDGSKNRTIQKNVYGPGFLKSPQKQISKHGVSFSKHLRICLKDLVKSTHR